MTTHNHIADQPAAAARWRRTADVPTRLGPWDVLALAAWFGLAAGWLEVGTRVLCKSLIGNNRLYLMTRHFVWLVPLSNLLLFLIGGGLLAAATKFWPRLAGWLSLRILCAAAILPALMVAGIKYIHGPGSSWRRVYRCVRCHGLSGLVSVADGGSR